MRLTPRCTRSRGAGRLEQTLIQLETKPSLLEKLSARGQIGARRGVRGYFDDVESTTGFERVLDAKQTAELNRAIQAGDVKDDDKEDRAMTEIESLVQRCIEADAARANSPLVAVLEREGDTAFNVLRDTLGDPSRALNPPYISSALRLLVAISKHRGSERGLDCMKVVLPYVRHPSTAVRSTAAHLIVWSGFADRGGAMGDEASKLGDLRAAVAEALALGVEPRYRATFEQFVSSLAGTTP